MHLSLRRLWLAWLSIVVVALLLTGLGVRIIGERTSRELGAPELAHTTAVVGQAIAADLERALGFGVPLPALVGVDAWFADIVQANPVIAALAVSDAQGRLLAGHGLPDGLAVALAGRTSAMNDTLDGLHLRTLPLHGRDGQPAGWLHVGGVAPGSLLPAWPTLLGLALPVGLAAVAGLCWLVQRRLARPLQQCREAVEQVIAGRLPRLPAPAARDPAAQLQRALAHRLADLRNRQAQLQLKIGEVRAAHFDPVVLARLDALAARAGADLDPDASLPAPREARAPHHLPDLPRRVLAAGAMALGLTAASLLVIQHLQDKATQRQLIHGAEQSLRHAWQATLTRDRAELEAVLQRLLSQPGLAADPTADEAAWANRFAMQAPPGLTLAVFRLDGTVLAASHAPAGEARLDSLTLAPLRAGQTQLSGIWQNAARAYQSGVAQRVPVDSPAPLVVMAARPLADSLRALQQQLDAPVAAADIRGNALAADHGALVGVWRTQARGSGTVETGGRPGVLAARPLTAPSGHALGTLLAQVEVPARPTAAETSLMIGAGLLGLGGLGALLAWLNPMMTALTRTTRRLERLAEGDEEPAADRHAEGAASSRLQQATQRLQAQIDAFKILRRSRERQGKRQARFIRHQMVNLASRLDEKARVGILEDLDRIEHATLPETTQARSAATDLRLERFVDEVGVLALGFQNLVSRVGDQYQELDRLVGELREALRVKTQFIALQQELEIARKMQLSILPRSFQTHEGLELHATMLPAKEVGGDFYDFFALDAHRVALVVADVSGKGVPAAFFMAVSRTLLRAIAQFTAGPGDCLARLNDLLAADNEEMMFVTVFYAVMDTRDGSLVYANGGHNPPCLLRADGRIEALPSTGDMALAVMDGLPYRERHLSLQPGDGLFLYTDGITEASGPDAQFFGEARLEATLQTLRALPAHELTQQMVATIKTFEAGGPQADDITCLMARYPVRP